MSDWERPGAMERALEHWARAAAAIDAIVLGPTPAEKPAVTKGVSAESRGGSNAPMPVLEAENKISVERTETVEGTGVASAEVDSSPRASVFGTHVFRWAQSQSHGELAPQLQGRKDSGCLIFARSLVRKPLDPTPGLFVGKQPEAGVHSVGLVFEDGYRVVTSMWAIRRAG